MQELANKRVWVVGLGASGRAAVDLLLRRGAKVVAIDSADTPQLRQDAEGLRGSGAAVRLGVQEPPTDALDLVVISPGVPVQSALVQSLVRRSLPLIGELELAPVGWTLLKRLGKGARQPTVAFFQRGGLPDPKTGGAPSK